METDCERLRVLVATSQFGVTVRRIEQYRTTALNSTDLLIRGSRSGIHVGGILVWIIRGKAKTGHSI